MAWRLEVFLDHLHQQRVSLAFYHHWYALISMEHSHALGPLADLDRHTGHHMVPDCCKNKDLVEEGA